MSCRILLSGVDDLRAAGCRLYVVSSAQSDENTIWVSEVWESKEHATPCAGRLGIRYVVAFKLSHSVQSVRTREKVTR